MQKTFFTALLLLFAAPAIFGQVVTRNVPPKPDATSAAGGEKPKTENKLPEMTGLAGQKAPAFAAVGISGNEYTLQNLRGKIVVLNLWGTFCAPCITEMPELNKLVERYKDKDVVFLAASPEQKPVLDVFLQKHSFSYDVLPDAMAIVRNFAPKKKVPSPTDRPGSFPMLLPAHLVIDQEGNVTEHVWGYKKTVTEDLSKTIDGLLSEKGQSSAANKSR